MRFCAVLEIVAATTMQLGAVGLLVAGIATSDWLLLYDRPSEQYHRHGLWQVCVQSGRRSALEAESVAETEDSKCTFLQHSERREGEIGDDLLHHFNDWNVACLVLLTVAAVIGIANLALACYGALRKAFSVVWMISAFVAAATAIGGIAVFTINANEASVKYVPLTTEVDTQHYGLSFWLALAGCVALGLVAVMSALFTFINCTSARNEQQRDQRTWVNNTTYHRVDQNTAV